MTGAPRKNENEIPPAMARELRKIGLEAETALRTRMIPFWLSLEDPLGGYWISVDSRGGIVESAPKTLVFAARTAWTFATAARAFGDPACKAGARRAYAHLDQFRDPQHDGFRASLSRTGSPLDRSKHVYGQAFALFALSAAAMAEDAERKARALALFETIEAQAHSGVRGLYVESFDECWSETVNADRALGETAARHTADTHLHLIEAYLELLRATRSKRVARALAALVDTFLANFLSADGRYTCQKLTGDGARARSTIWPGHDIEAGWLLDDAAEFAESPDVSAQVRSVALSLARGAIGYGMLDSGAWRERVEDGTAEAERILWWVQAEAVLGMISLGLRWRDTDMLERALRTWAFVREFFVDQATGDWRLQVAPTGARDPVAPRVVHWKDPYHQARACMEISSRIRSRL